jgi:hypothetical protein
VTEQASSTVTDLTDEVGRGIAACTDRDETDICNTAVFVSVRDVE